MVVTCPKCGREIPASDVNLAEAIARCLPCNAVFACGNRSGAYSKPLVQMPKSFTVEQNGPELVLTHRWYSPGKAFGLLFFTVFWDGFLLVWYGIAFASNGPLVMKLFPLLHVAVGVGMTYLTVATFVNKTVIRAGPQEVSVLHGPLRWPGDAALARRDLQQLFCEEKISRTKNGTSITYKVWAVLRDRRVALASGLDTPEQALFIEQQVERRLGILDRPVPGELRG